MISSGVSHAYMIRSAGSNSLFKETTLFDREVEAQRMEETRMLRDVGSRSLVVSLSKLAASSFARQVPRCVLSYFLLSFSTPSSGEAL